MLAVTVACMRYLQNARLWQKLLCLVFPASQFALVAFVLWCVVVYHAPAWLLATLTVLGVACGPVDVLLFRVLGSACGHFEAAEQVRELEGEVAAQAMVRERSAHERQEADAICRRIRTELEAAERDLRDRRASEAGESLGRAIGIIGSAASRACLHPAVDSLISVKARDANQAGVRFRTQLNVPADLAIPSAELCAVFSNLIDNALNACQAVPQGNRFVNITARIWGLYFVVDVENSCAQGGASREGAPCCQAGANTLFDELSEGADTGCKTVADKGTTALGPAKTNPEAPAATQCASVVEPRVEACAPRTCPSRAVPDLSVLHGWGQGIVASIASRHKGQFTTQRNDGCYAARVILKIDGGEAR